MCYMDTISGAHTHFFKVSFQIIYIQHTITWFTQGLFNSANFAFNGAPNNTIDAATTY